MTDPADSASASGSRPDSGSEQSVAASRTAAARLRAGLHPRAARNQIVAAVLCALVGFGVVAQVRATNDDTPLRTARTPDLVRLLDDLNQRQQRLDAERDELTITRDRLLSGADSKAAARKEAQQRAAALGVLAGTVADSGPGVVVRVADPGSKVSAAVLVDAVQELRDAGAEAIQVGDVRVVASTSFVDGPDGSVLADGTPLERPWEIRAVGDSATLAAALDIPGGVVDTVARAGGTATVDRRNRVDVDALRVLPTPRYAQPVPTP